MAKRTNSAVELMASVLRARRIREAVTPEDLRNVVAVSIGDYVSSYGPVLSYQVERALESIPYIGRITRSPLSTYIAPSHNPHLTNPDYSFTSLDKAIELATEEERGEHLCEVRYVPRKNAKRVGKRKSRVTIQNSNIFYRDLEQLKDFVLDNIQGVEKVKRYSFVIP